VTPGQVVDRPSGELNVETAVLALKVLIGAMPQVNRRVLEVLIGLLGRIADQSQVNLMSAANLSIGIFSLFLLCCLSSFFDDFFFFGSRFVRQDAVFGPNLLRSGEAELANLVNKSALTIAVIQMIIEERARIFSPEALQPLSSASTGSSGGSSSNAAASSSSNSSTTHNFAFER
jgi:hypothetical protein